MKENSENEPKGKKKDILTHIWNKAQQKPRKWEKKENKTTDKAKENRRTQQEKENNTQEQLR